MVLSAIKKAVCPPSSTSLRKYRIVINLKKKGEKKKKTDEKHDNIRGDKSCRR